MYRVQAVAHLNYKSWRCYTKILIRSWRSNGDYWSASIFIYVYTIRANITNSIVSVERYCYRTISESRPVVLIDSPIYGKGYVSCTAIDRIPHRVYRATRIAYFHYIIWSSSVKIFSSCRGSNRYCWICCVFIYYHCIRI